jgi:hypothetical protein
MADTDHSQSPTLRAMARVVNTGSTTFTDQYALEKYTIEPGSEQFVPFDAICLWMGDPRLQDLGPRDRHRTDEFMRVCIRLGAHDGDLDILARNKPSLECYTLEGVLMKMVVDDPEGPGQNIFNTDQPTNETTMLHTMMNAMKKLAQKPGMESIMEELGLAASTHPDLPNTDINTNEPPSQPPADTPQSIKVGSGS